MLVASENWGWLRIIAANLYSCVPDLFIHVCVSSYTHTNIFLLILTIMCWSGTIIITTLHTNKLRSNEVKQPSQVTQLNPDHLHPGSVYYMDSPDMALQGLSGGSRLSHAGTCVKVVPQCSCGTSLLSPKAVMADTHWVLTTCQVMKEVLYLHYLASSPSNFMG